MRFVEPGLSTGHLDESEDFKPPENDFACDCSGRFVNAENVQKA